MFKKKLTRIKSRKIWSNMNPDREKISLATVLFNLIHQIERVKHCMTLCLNSPLLMISRSKGHNTDKQP